MFFTVAFLVEPENAKQGLGLTSMRAEKGKKTTKQPW